MSEVVRDVHTEHCCAKHGCKYSWQTRLTNECTVMSGEKSQSHMCEVCSDWLDENWDLVVLLNEMWDAGFARGEASALREVEIW